LVCELNRSTVKEALAILEKSGFTARNNLPITNPLQSSLPVTFKKVAGEKEKNLKAKFELI
jgi:hypothetical protein